MQLKASIAGLRKNKKKSKYKITPVLNIQWHGNSKIILFYLRNTAKHCSGSLVSPKDWKIWSQLLHPEICTKAAWYGFNSWIKPRNSLCCCLLVRTGWTQNLTFFLFSFRNIITSCQLHFFSTIHFLRTYFFHENKTCSRCRHVTWQVQIYKIWNFMPFYATRSVCNGLKAAK